MKNGGMGMVQALAFHLAFPVQDLQEAEAFYTHMFHCKVGRKNHHSIVFNFFGHQVVAHHAPDVAAENRKNLVDGQGVPIRHFGCVVPWEDWQAIAARLKEEGVEFVIEPYIRYEGSSGEQATMFFHDPSGNALEFKAFKDPRAIFSPWETEEAGARFC
jgi:extradiol dioxygenase family protein